MCYLSYYTMAESTIWVVDSTWCSISYELVVLFFPGFDIARQSGSGVPVPAAAGTETACRRSDPAPGSAGRTP